MGFVAEVDNSHLEIESQLWIERCRFERVLLARRDCYVVDSGVLTADD